MFLNATGHFLLTNLLLDKMKATAKKKGVQGRIINVSSNAHRISDGSCFNLDKINDQSKLASYRITYISSWSFQLAYLIQYSCHRYKPFVAYAHSKLANILHANELSKHLQVCINYPIAVKYNKDIYLQFEVSCMTLIKSGYIKLHLIIIIRKRDPMWK